MKRLLLICTFCLQFLTIINAQWQPTNGPYGGNINGLAIKDQYIFALIAGSGVFISSDNGNSWSQRNNGLTNLDVLCIAVKGSRIFVGTANGLFSSDDNGSTWNTVLFNGLANFSVNGLGSNTKSIFVLLGSSSYPGDTLYKSNDGSTWVKNLFDASFNSLGVCGDTVFIGSNDGYLFRSTDNGMNFHSVDLTGYSDLLDTRTFTYSGSYLFASGQAGMIYKSADNGTTWTPANAGLNYSFNATLAANGTKLYAGSYYVESSYYGGLYVSENNGANWTSLGLTGLTVDKVIFSGNRIIAGTWPKGIFISDDGGNTWKSSSTGLVKLSILALTNNGPDLFASCSVNSFFGGDNLFYIFKSTDKGTTWFQSDSGMSNKAIGVFAVGNSYMLAGGPGVYISTNHGLSWRLLFNPGYTINSLVILNSLIFAGTQFGIFLSEDSGNNWHSVNNGLDNTNITTMISKGDFLFAGTSSEIYRSSDNGSNWIKVSNGIEGFYNNGMASNNDFLFASGYSQLNGIFRSSDNGDNWILSLPLSCSVISFAVSNDKVIAGTSNYNSEVLFSGNNGETWSVVNTGLPDYFDISSLVILDSTVYAGLTNEFYNPLGCGVWKRPLSEFIPFDLLGDTVLLEETAGDQKNLTITSSTSWVLDGQLPTWLSVNKNSGTGSDLLSLTSTTANPNQSPRYSFLNIVSEGISRPFTVIQKGTLNGIDDQPLKTVSVFPNPTSGKIIINSPESYNKLTLTSAPGQILYEQVINSSKTQLDLQHFGKGVYYLRFSGKNNSCIKEVVVL